MSDGETPAALAVTRSLASAGFSVSVLAPDRRAPAAASRFSRATVIVPDPGRDPSGWTDRVVDTVLRRTYDVLLPITDTALLLADRVRGDLSRHVRLAMSDPEALARSLDKTVVLDRAAALGIPVLSRLEEDRVARATLPAVVKPRRSRALSGGAVLTATACVVGSRTALAREAERLARAGLGAYVEPWAPGAGKGIFLLLRRGEVLARFAHRRIREASPLGGPSAVCESVPADPTLLRHAEALARDLGVEGPFMAEFRGDVLLEVNARYWGSLGLAIDAGVDFPALHVRSLMGEPEPGPPGWEIGLRRRNLAFDVRRTARVLRGRPDGLEVPWPGRLATLRGLARERAGGIVHRRGDPAPGRGHLLRLLLKAVGRA
ncbi:MAG: carboxylate--amine ligase [Planctomycetota bacterium]